MSQEPSLRSDRQHFHRFVAVGDSFVEGVGDPDATRPNGLRGWVDIVAEQLAAQNPDLLYANLGIRGKVMRQIVPDQIDAAVAMTPDLVVFTAGVNDLLRPRVDFAWLRSQLDDAFGKLTATGATVVAFTTYDTDGVLLFELMRGRFAIYNEIVRELADRHGVQVVDFWRFHEYADARLWDWDRIHMSSHGHRNMAIRVLERLGVPCTLAPVEPSGAPRAAGLARVGDNIEWFRGFAVPWIGRRVRGISTGDSLSPKYPELTLAAELP